MRYLVRAHFIEEKMGEFFRKLSDDTIARQKPDGQEILIINLSLSAARISNSTPEAKYCETGRDGCGPGV